MADITMCLNKKCPKNVLCYRYTAKPNEYRQSYSDFKPELGEDVCNNYIPNYVKKDNK